MSDYPTARCFRTDAHESHVWDQYTKCCPGTQSAVLSAQERTLAAARVADFITAPSWVRSSYAGTQAEQILALVLDTKACAAERTLPDASIQQVCYREEGHFGMHFAAGQYAWDLTDEELDARHDAQMDKDIEAHDRMLDATMEDR